MLITPSLRRFTGTTALSTILFSTVLIGGFPFQSTSLPPQSIASINLNGYDTLVTPAPITADDYYNRGLFFQGQGDLEGALDQFDKAIALEPYNPDLYFSRGLTQTDIGDHKNALADYSKAIDIDNTFAAAYYQRAMSRMVIPIARVTNFSQPSISRPQRETMQLAIQDFSNALDHSPEFVAAHYYRGLSHYVMGDESLAWQDYQQARTLNPQIANAFYRQGFTQLYIGGPNSHQ